jgi:hypothetical protein
LAGPPHKQTAPGQDSANRGGAKPDASGAYFASVQDAPRKLIIVVGGASVEQVKRMAAEMPWIPEGSWYADPSNQTAVKFKLQAAPVVAGITDGVIKWRYVGLPPEGLPLRSLMSAWHERREEHLSPRQQLEKQQQIQQQRQQMLTSPESAPRP